MALTQRGGLRDSGVFPRGKLDALFAGLTAKSAPDSAIFDWRPYPKLPPAGRTFLEQLLRLPLLSPATLRAFLDPSLNHHTHYDSAETLGNVLVQAGLITEYQLDRVLAGNTHGLVLGNYRVLQRLGAGSMAVVFLAEHYLMKRQAAVKVLPVDEECPVELHDRFYAEMQVLADLRHPNIVLAYDAGELPPAGPRTPPLAYLVMELVDGGDLEHHTLEHGVASVPQACEWIRQAACGLQEAHDHHLIHRDIKPSNLLLTRHGQIKVVDFGLARQFCSSMTAPRSLVGSVEFMSPEQSRDPSSVAAPADIYGLGATLFWLLTGDLPHATRPTLVAALKALQEEPPRKLRVLRGDAPAELEQLLDQLLDRDPANRPPTPLAVMRALSRFTSTGAAAYEIDLGEGAGSFPVPDSHNDGDAPADRPRRVLIAHEDEDFCHRAAHLLRDLNCTCDSTGEGGLALETMCGDQYDLAIIDRKLSDMDGAEAIRRLRQHPYSPNLRILALVDADPPDALADALGRGADDALPRQFTPKQLTAKVQHALQTKAALDRYEQMARQLSQTIQQLDNSLRSRSHDVRQAQNALLFAMARIAESREGETPGHLRRMQRFARCLAEQAAGDAAWADLVSEEFLEELERCVPLHDIGKIGLPDALLLKPGELTPAERATMETHTVMGSSILESLGREHGGALTFLGMAHAIVRHHHERYDGQGYPDRLSGIDIPPAARLVAVADVYDALRRQRSHRPALSHAEAVRCITEQSPGQFDPVLLQTFAACHPRFERIFREIHE